MKTSHDHQLDSAVMNRVLRSVVLAAAVVSLASCSDSPANGDKTAAGVNGGNKDAALTTSSVPDLTAIVHPPATGEFVGAVADISAHTCEQVSTGWRVTGTATNPTAGIVDYRIYISLLNGTLATRALVEVEVDGLAAGAADSFDELIAIPDDDLRCVLRVERRDSGSS